MNYSAKSFTDACKSCTSASEALLLAKAIENDDASSSAKAYSSKIAPTWSMFYALLEMERKFDIGCHHSSIVAIDLCNQALSKKYIAKKNGDYSTTIEFGDLCSHMYIALNSGIMDEFDPNVNDNFLAFFLSKIRTATNEVLAPEIPIYIQKVYGYSLDSLDKILSNEESSYEPEDKTIDVVATVMQKEDEEKLKVLRVQTPEVPEDISKEDFAKIKDSVDNKRIKNTVIGGKLMNGVTSWGSNMINAMEDFRNDDKERI